MYLDGTCYWYGENKEKTDGISEVWHWGVRCYSSREVYNGNRYRAFTPIAERFLAQLRASFPAG